MLVIVSVLLIQLSQ